MSRNSRRTLSVVVVDSPTGARKAPVASKAKKAAPKKAARKTAKKKATKK